MERAAGFIPAGTSPAARSSPILSQTLKPRRMIREGKRAGVGRKEKTPDTTELEQFAVEWIGS
jgi:hypothetical protein